MQKKLENGVIRSSTSPCGYPNFLAMKKDGTWQWRSHCVDFGTLNKFMVKNHYPLPRIDVLLNQLKDVIYFTKLNLRSGYHQIILAEGDTWKTTFKANIDALHLLTRVKHVS